MKNVVFETEYKGEFGRNSLNKRIYQKDRIVDRIYSSNVNYCWEVVGANGVLEFRSEFESGNYSRYLCQFEFEGDICCFNEDFTKIYRLKDNFSIDAEYQIQNPFIHKDDLFFLRAGYSTVSDEIPFLFGSIWYSRNTKYFSVLKIDKKEKSARWLHKASRDYLLSTLPHREYERAMMDEEGMIFPLRTYFGEAFIDDIIWDGQNFAVKRYASFQWHPQRPEYQIILLDKMQKNKSVIYSPQNYQDHIYLLQSQLVLGSPNSFYRKTRKTNNQYLWNIDTNSFIEISLPREFKGYYTHYIEPENFMTLSSYDKETDISHVLNIDLKN